MNELDRLAKLYGTDKQTNEEGQFIYHGYTPIYHHFLEPYRDTYESILEIGVLQGWSHLMWKDYFPNAKIYGIDIFSESVARDVSDERITIIKGSQDDKNLIDKFFTEQHLDMIIDDGSHTSWHQQKSFAYLWSKLKYGGYYFIEDLAVSQLREFREFEDWNSSTLGWLESLNTDNPHSYYIDNKSLLKIISEIKYMEKFGELLVIRKGYSIEPKAYFVVSNWNNDVSWVNDFTENYIIYDKSDTLPEDDKILKLENVGFNIFDICHFIVNNYDDLPELIAFVQGWPFNHCKRETFNKLIFNECFTPIEDYTHIKGRKGEDGGYLEFNNSYYLKEKEPYTHRYYNSYDGFMTNIFSDYIASTWVRFAPGGQYIVPKKNILYYSKRFWEKLMNIVSYDRLPVEGFLIERALYTIFANKFREKTA